MDEKQPVSCKGVLPPPEISTDCWVEIIRQQGSGWIMGKYTGQKLSDTDNTGHQHFAFFGRIKNYGDIPRETPSVSTALLNLFIINSNQERDKNWFFHIPGISGEDFISYVCWSHPKSEYTADRGRAKDGHPFIFNLILPQQIAESLSSKVDNQPDLIEKIFHKMYLESGQAAEKAQRVKTQSLKTVKLSEHVSGWKNIIKSMARGSIRDVKFSREVGELSR